MTPKSTATRVWHFFLLAYAVTLLVGAELSSAAGAKKSPFRSTNELALSTTTKAAVIVLQSAPRLESPTLSLGGAKSDIYPLYEAVVQHASKSELAQLLYHDSPVVRLYIARYWIEHFPEESHQLLGLASDATKVPFHQGCRVGTMPVNAEVVNTLCAQRELRPVQEVLLQIARDKKFADMRGHAVACVSIYREEESYRIAQEMLKGSDPSVVPGAVSVLRKAESKADMGLVWRWSKSDDAAVRRAVACATCDATPSRALLEQKRLMSDPSSDVRWCVASCFFKQGGTDPELLKKLQADPDFNIQRLVRESTQ